jgi:hypothetical protein
MLVIGVSLVSFWKSLSPSDFQAWFASHSHLIGRVMIPLGAGGVAVTVAAAVACWRGKTPGRGWLLIAAVSAIGVMSPTRYFSRPPTQRSHVGAFQIQRRGRCSIVGRDGIGFKPDLGFLVSSRHYEHFIDDHRARRGPRRLHPHMHSLSGSRSSPPGRSLSAVRSDR